MTSAPTYTERLTVPLRWWVQATMFLATIWLAFIVALPAWLAWTGALVLLALVFGFFAALGSARVCVQDGELHAGPAHIPLDLIGTPEALDREATRRLLGVEADARAFLVTRPYLKRAVKVPVLDPADPTPYWVVSTRHPRTLAAAISGTDRVNP